MLKIVAAGFLAILVILVISLSTASASKPKIIDVSIKPEKAIPGQTLTISAFIESNLPIKFVKAEMSYEKGYDLINLSLIQGTFTNGKWN